MLILFMLLWMIAAILILTDIKNESTRWGGLLAFFAGCGGLGVVWRESVVPSLAPYITNSTVSYFVALIGGVFASFAYYFGPYSLLMFAIVTADWLKEKIVNKKRVVSVVLLIPIAIMYILFPVEPFYQISFYLLVVCIAPYILVANIILICSYFMEKDLRLKRQKFLNCIIVVIPTFISLFMNFILPALGFKSTYSPFVIAVVFVIFIIASVRYGIMGVKLKLDKYRNVILENVMEHITDSFIVVDEKNRVTRFNQTYVEYFGEIKIEQDFISILECNPLFIKIKKNFMDNIKKAKQMDKVVRFESHIFYESNYDRYFTIEVNPINITDKYLGSIILFKDITEHKRMIYLIEQNQNQLIENERLVTLNQLVGGIAHNLKTPLMASSGGIEILSNNIEKIKRTIMESGGDDNQFNKDIFEEMELWENRLREYISYMNEVVTTVKGQAVPVSVDNEIYFEVKKIIDRVNILMKHELNRASCKINYYLSVDENLKLKGNINYIIQVINNLISNAIDSYENEKNGVIEIKIEKKLTDKIDIIVKDYGKGIREDIKNKLFKQMITTKGKGGTGLGLYISKSIITSKFNGEIRVESVEGEGSSFIITIPIGGDGSEYHAKYSNS